MAQTSGIQELISMGYSQAQATRALQVAHGDIEQAVGFLLMGEQSQVGFYHPERNSIAAMDSALPAAAADASTASCRNPSITMGSGGGGRGATVLPDTSDEEDDAVTELVQMGYNRQNAQQALNVAQGDVGQAINFLCMGDSRAGFLTALESSFRLDDDAAMAAMLQEDELTEAITNTTSAAAPPDEPESGMYHPTSVNNPANVPKMVASQSFLTTPGAGPFCTCVGASRFLSGGVVTSEFLNSILQDGVELFRKTDGSTDQSVNKVLKKFGKSNLKIEALMEEDAEPKQGVFMDHDLHHVLGIRKQLALCRNQQGPGWQLLILEIPMFDSFCICLPPKGTKNKFWYLDFVPRSHFRVPGAYARVHNSLLQLEESLESIFLAQAKNTEKGYASFLLYTIKTVK